MSGLVLQGDCRVVMLDQGPFDCIIADPPYGDTSLAWDKMVRGWERVARDRLKRTGSMWVFGSLRFFMLAHRPMRRAGLRVAQEIVWEKHNGSGFHADRFKRVHELAVQVIRDDANWGEVYNEVQTTPDAVARSVKRKKGRPAHMGSIDAAPYASEDGGPRIMRSVIYARSCHGRAIHPTQKPVDLLEVLVRTSCPPGGLVGDFFAGSGAAGDAAQMLGRRYVGCELDADYAAAAQARLSATLPLGAAA
jgi:site-specific DNA-methyltransferase (adenine-specific)